MIDSFSGDHRWLSNFWYFNLDGKETTVEHIFQSMKTVDDDEAHWVLSQPTPGEAKKAGRSVTLRDDWESVKLGVMRDALEYKFSRYSALASKLLLTGDERLVEGNTWGDTFWGVCRGSGTNWLGHLLMARRAELRGS